MVILSAGIRSLLGKPRSGPESGQQRHLSPGRIHHGMGGRHHLGTVGGIISEWRAASFRNRGRLRPESAHGYWDGDEREFRGFGRVEQRDSETFASYRSRKLSKPLYAEMFSPPVLTKTWFQLGPVELASGQDWQELDFADEWW